MVFFAISHSTNSVNPTTEEADESGRREKMTHPWFRVCSMANRNSILEGSVVVSLIATAAIVSSLAFVLLTYQEQKLYESQYRLISNKALNSTNNRLKRASSGGMGIAAVYSIKFPDAAQWPNVSLPSYRDIASHVNDMTGFLSTSFHPMVTPAQAPGYEHFAIEAIKKNPYYPAGTGVSSFGEGIFRIDPLNGPPPDYRVHDGDGYTSWGSEKEIMFPLMDAVGQHENISNQYVLFNAHSLPNLGRAMDEIIDCATNRATLQDTSIQCGGVSEIYDFYGVGFEGFDPEVTILQPVYPANNRTTLVGVTVAVIQWSVLFSDAIPDEVAELVAVIENDQEFYTFSIDRGHVQFVGIGDLHDRGLSKYANARSVLTSGSTAGTSTTYKVTFYPTKDFFDSFRTNLPTYACIAGLGIIFFTSAIFGAFAYFTRVDSSERAMELDEKRMYVRFISHEVRTPLNAAVMGIQVMDAELQKRKLALENKCELQSADHQIFPEWENLLKDVRMEMDTVSLVLDDLLYYDTIHSQSMEIEKKLIPVWHFLRNECRAFYGRAQQRGVDLQVNLERWSPSAMLVDNLKQQQMRHIFLLGDASRIAQVLKVLLSNALKYSPEGSRVIASACWVQDSTAGPVQVNGNLIAPRTGLNLTDHHQEVVRNGILRIRVQDSGNGMSAEVVQKIQNEGIRFKMENLNVGESVALNQEVAADIVEKHHGTMRVESEGLGKGTTFIVELPVYFNPSHLAITGSSEQRSRRSSLDSPPDFHARSSLTSSDPSARKYSAVHTVGSTTAALQGVSAMAVSALSVPSFEEMHACRDLEAGVNTVNQYKDTLPQNFLPSSFRPLLRQEDAVVEDESGDATFTKKRALVVDDVISNRKMLIRLLKMKGFECLEAKHGQEAVDLFFAQKPEDEFTLVSMDFEMPVMNGPTATKLLRERGCRCLIVGVTGNVVQADVSYFVEQGADIVLAKPLQIEDLMSVSKHRLDYVRAEECTGHSDGSEEISSPREHSGPPPASARDRVLSVERNSNMDGEKAATSSNHYSALQFRNLAAGVKFYHTKSKVFPDQDIRSPEETSSPNDVHVSAHRLARESPTQAHDINSQFMYDRLENNLVTPPDECDHDLSVNEARSEHRLLHATAAVDSAPSLQSTTPYEEGRVKKAHRIVSQHEHLEERNFRSSIANVSDCLISIFDRSANVTGENSRSHAVSLSCHNTESNLIGANRSKIIAPDVTQDCDTVGFPGRR